MRGGIHQKIIFHGIAPILVFDNHATSYGPKGAVDNKRADNRASALAKALALPYKRVPEYITSCHGLATESQDMAQHECAVKRKKLLPRGTQTRTVHRTSNACVQLCVLRYRLVPSFRGRTQQIRIAKKRYSGRARSNKKCFCHRGRNKTPRRSGKSRDACDRFEGGNKCRHRAPETASYRFG